MNDAIWFAETCGLFPRNVICESFEGKQIEVSDVKTKAIQYSGLPDIEKDKLRQKVYICDIFIVSDSAYYEFSSICSTMSSIRQMKDCRTDFNREFEIKRTPDSFPGAFLSLDAELERAITEEYKDTIPNRMSIKIAGDGTKVTRISNFGKIQFSLVKDSNSSYEN